MFVLTRLLAAVALAVLAPVAESATPTLDQLMAQLLHPDTVTREGALRDVVRRGDRAAVPGLIDSLYFDLFLDSTLANVLGELTGQAFGHDWRRWVEWLAEREDVRPHRDYAAWKASLLQRIDPAFGEFLYAGVKHRARLEEIQWGGVGKDGIPAPILCASWTGTRWSTTWSAGYRSASPTERCVDRRSTTRPPCVVELMYDQQTKSFWHHM